ncbi:hypothetical protein M378DRAFT_92717, partial [Amanita muscaria Koide BX008]
CLEGTGTEILDEIKGWVTTTHANALQVLWLSGPAGTGKSAIAHSVSRWWMERMGASGLASVSTDRLPHRPHVMKDSSPPLRLI